MPVSAPIVDTAAAGGFGYLSVDGFTSEDGEQLGDVAGAIALVPAVVLVGSAIYGFVKAGTCKRAPASK
jgi:hypothetical protein